MFFLKRRSSSKDIGFLHAKYLPQFKICEYIHTRRKWESLNLWWERRESTQGTRPESQHTTSTKYTTGLSSAIGNKDKEQFFLSNTV
jgi:hypothetical protein